MQTHRALLSRQQDTVLKALFKVSSGIIIIIIILGLCYHFSPLWRNPSLDSFHWCLWWANLVQVVPRCRLRSSLHLVFGLPRGLNHLGGTQDVALMVHLLSWSLATWPAHRCFDCLMWSMMSVTPVCCRIQVLCLWSRSDKATLIPEGGGSGGRNGRSCMRRMLRYDIYNHRSTPQDGSREEGMHHLDRSNNGERNSSHAELRQPCPR